MSLETKVNEFVAELLDGYNPLRVRNKKAIHDSLFGTHMFMEHEVAILDTPLIQRLRRISQTGLAYYTYPSATHTRFSHTLGVAILTDKMTRKISDHVDPPVKCESQSGELAELRVAALLHDCGHGFLSHLSEQIYGKLFKRQIDEIKIKYPQLKGSKEHEIISYLIVKSSAFEVFFEKYIKDGYGATLDLGNIANYIVGRAEPDKQYLAEIISGPFDVDKLDYIARDSMFIARDSMFTGLQLNIDVERLFYTISVKPHKQQKRLAIGFYGARALEQLLFSKMMLHSSVYDHQKVRACDCTVKGLIEYIVDEEILVNNQKLNGPISFVRLTDFEVLSGIRSRNKQINKFIKSINNRVFFKRALTLCQDTIDNYEDGVADELSRLTKLPHAMRQLRQNIADKLKKGPDQVYSIWLDLPRRPELKEPTTALVESPNGEINTLDDYFPVKGWLDAYTTKKWRGHVFCPADLQNEVGMAAKKAICEYFEGLGKEIRINKDAFTYSHNDIKEMGV